LTREEGAKPLSPLVLCEDTGFPPERIHEHEAIIIVASKLDHMGAKGTGRSLMTASDSRAAAASKLNRAGAKTAYHSPERATARFFAEAKPSPRCKEEE